VRVTLFDYGAGNLHSLAKAFATPGVTIAIEHDPIAALATDLLVLPGVGAFGPAAEALAPGRERMRDALAAGLPCIGICLGAQLLFEASDEARAAASDSSPAACAACARAAGRTWVGTRLRATSRCWPRADS